jgi:hypothetical protein
VRQQAGGTSFGLEPVEKFFSRQAGALFGELQGFYGHRAPDERIIRAIDHTHGAAADFTGDFVSARFG